MPAGIKQSLKALPHIIGFYLLKSCAVSGRKRRSTNDSKIETYPEVVSTSVDVVDTFGKSFHTYMIVPVAGFLCNTVSASFMNFIRNDQGNILFIMNYLFKVVFCAKYINLNKSTKI